VKQERVKDMEILSSLKGSTFGRLTLIEPTTPKETEWVCKCVCGVVCTVKRHSLLSGNKKSCGCLKRSVLGDLKRTHGMANSRAKGYANRAYGIWQAMKDRCLNPNRKDFHRYGARGIYVCERWMVFENFYEDMGYPPQGATLDRVDNNGPYSKNNCRWASRKEQVHNSTRTKYIEVDGVVQKLQEWLVEKNISRDVYYRRKRKGLSDQEALTYGDAK
jgi:hypothetical protein